MPTTIDDDVFLITAGARTGSNWLRSAIHTAPDVQYHREQWNFYIPGRFDLAPSYEDFLDQVETTRVTHKRNMFKIATDQCPYITELLADRPNQVIFQHRKNLLAQHSSEQLGLQFQTWITPNQLDDSRLHVRFHSHAFSAFVINRMVLVSMIIRHHPNIFVTEYETAYRDVPLIAKRFGLDMDVTQMQPVEKINSSNILGRFNPADHTAVIAALRGLNRMEWLVDKTDIPLSGIYE